MTARSRKWLRASVYFGRRGGRIFLTTEAESQRDCTCSGERSELLQGAAERELGFKTAPSPSQCVTLWSQVTPGLASHTALCSNPITGDTQ